MARSRSFFTLAEYIGAIGVASATYYFHRPHLPGPAGYFGRVPYFDQEAVDGARAYLSTIKMGRPKRIKEIQG